MTNFDLFSQALLDLFGDLPGQAHLIEFIFHLTAWWQGGHGKIFMNRQPEDVINLQAVRA
jgi:hypothetical protein